MKFTVNELKWDSNFFNKRIGEVFLVNKNVLVENQEHFDLIYVKQNKKFKVKIKGFLETHEETKVVFIKKVLKEKSTKIGYVYSANDENYNLNEIYNLAYESGKFSRFKLDVGFKEDDFRNLYEKWIDNSLIKQYADDVLFVKKNDTVVGFATYKICKEYAHIGLIAIKPEEQGQGFGQLLINSLENILLKKGIPVLKIATQLQNQMAYKFYLKCGYTIEEESIIKHFWRQ